jgi:hypothetical protein
MKTRIYATVNQNVVRDLFPRYNKVFKFIQFLQYFEIGEIDECWEWKGSLLTSNKEDMQYGCFTWPDKKIRLAHVASYVFFKGSIPKRKGKKRLCVCHTCDNPKCVNPNHLWLGTYKDNVKDSVSKGRHKGWSYHHVSYGEDNTSSKLTNKLAAKIRAKYATGKYSQQRLADKYEIHQTLVSAVVRNRIWKSLTKSIQ